MKTLGRHQGLHVLVLALAWMGLAAAGAAQQVQLPVPGNQTPPSFQYHPRPSPSAIPPAPSSRVQTIPQLQQAQPEVTPAPAYVPAPQYTRPPAAPVYRPAPQSTPPPLPAIFRGCWKGRVDFVDSIQRLPGAAPVGPWTPKKYLLCYRQTGNGPFELTFTEAGIAHSNKIINATGKMDVVSTDGRTYASMRSLLHFDEYRLPSDPSGQGTFPVDELTNLSCEIRPDGMHVSGSVYGERDGVPWFRATWRAIFVRTPDQEPLPE